MQTILRHCMNDKTGVIGLEQIEVCIIEKGLAIVDLEQLYASYCVIHVASGYAFAPKGVRTNRVHITFNGAYRLFESLQRTGINFEKTVKAFTKQDAITINAIVEIFYADILGCNDEDDE